MKRLSAEALAKFGIALRQDDQDMRDDGGPR